MFPSRLGGVACARRFCGPASCNLERSEVDATHRALVDPFGNQLPAARTTLGVVHVSFPAPEQSHLHLLSNSRNRMVASRSAEYMHRNPHLAASAGARPWPYACEVTRARTSDQATCCLSRPGALTPEAPASVCPPGTSPSISGPAMGCARRHVRAQRRTHQRHRAASPPVGPLVRARDGDRRRATSSAAPWPDAAARGSRVQRQLPPDTTLH